MCKYKDTDLGIKKLDFNFESLSRIYSIKDVLRC